MKYFVTHNLLRLKSLPASARRGVLLRCGIALLVCCIAIFSGGCAFLNPGDMKAIQPVSPDKRVGQVAILRGMIGIWSLGLDGLGSEINAQGIHTVVFQDDQWPYLARTIAKNYRGVARPEPLTIIGHSYGADNAVRIARVLNSHGIKVDMLITIDPVVPPRVPPNVTTALDYYATRGVTDALPWWRGVPLKADAGFKGTLMNYDLSTNRRDLRAGDVSHPKIEKDLKIHAEIIQRLLEICPTKEQWLAATPAVPAAAPLATPPPAAPARIVPVSKAAH